MTIDTMERELTQGAQAPTESFLRSQLDQLRDLIESETDSNVVSELTKLRDNSRNHLSALLLRNDSAFAAAYTNALSEIRHGDVPRGVVTPSELDDLLGL